MRTLNHQNHKSFIQWKHMTRVTSGLDHAFQLKIVCDDGELFCDRLLFILWSKHWREILDPNEEESVLIFPGVKKRSMMLLLKLLMVGDIKGFEKSFESFFELTLDFFNDFPGGFSNFETSDKSFDVKASCIKNRRNKFQTSKKNTCEYCLSNFSSKQAKERHIEHYHLPKKVYNCSTCNKTFKSSYGLKTHLKTKHKSSEVHKCSVCDASFTNEANLKRHQKSRHETMKYTCLECKKVFDSSIELKQHLDDSGHKKRTLLKKIDVFKCSECDFQTSRKDSLLRHKRLKHGIFRKEFNIIKDTLKDNGNWTCSKCNKTFTSEEEIEDHVISCKEIKCHLCEKAFTLKSHLKRHIETQHPYICTNCNERFKTAKILRKHSKKCLKK